MADEIGNLTKDPAIVRLIHYKFYKYLLGNYLPGDYTLFLELKRAIPNTYIVFDKESFNVVRFFPSKEICYCNNDSEYERTINEACDVLKRTMAIIAKKWRRPFISLTGGIDSNTTFAAANGYYSKFKIPES